MTDKESSIYKVLKDNPGITSEKVAEILGMSKLSVQICVELLKQKGYILEDGSINNSSLSVTIIGGSNVDIQGKCIGNMRMHDSNVGAIKFTRGGVGRNIAENFARLGGDLRFITALARDEYGRKIFEHLQDLGIDIYDSILSRDYETSTYMYILNEKGEMVVAVNDMSIMKLIDDKLIINAKDKINRSVYTFFDGNVSEEAIKAIFDIKKGTKIVVDPVSVAKVDKIKPYLSQIYCIKLNNYEASKLSDIYVVDEDTAIKAAEYFIEQGVEKVFITMGAKGVLYMSKNNMIYKPAYKTEVKNATGAGDAFSGAMIYAMVNDYSDEEIVELGMGAALLTIEHEETCVPDMSLEKIKERLAREI